MPKTTRSSWTTQRRARGARSVLLAVAVIFCALLAMAATSRTPRPRRPLPVQEPQTSSRFRTHGRLHSTSRSPAAKTAHPLTHSQSRIAPHSAPHTTLHGRRTHPVPADNPDPPTVERIHNRVHANARDRIRSRRAPVASPHRLTAADARRAAALQSAQLAARIEAGVEAEAQSQARANSRAAPLAEARLQPPAPIVRTPPAQHRVDGFGAEGAILPAPPADTESPNDADADLPAAAPIPAAAEPDLEALAHPTTAQLGELAVQPRLYTGSGRLILPAPLKGSHDVLVHQNLMADGEGLSRIQDDDELDRLRAARLLVDFPVSESLHLNPELPANRRCARPWTVRFAADTARAFYARFHQPLQINSAVRTVDVQLRLERTNSNAAATEGDTASPHLTGQAIDFAKRGMSLAQLAWMRSYLLPLMNSGKVDVEEEFQQACFHISVYRSYLPAPRRRPAPRTLVAQLPAR